MNSKKYRIIIILTAVFLLSLLLTACGTDSNANSPTMQTNEASSDQPTNTEPDSSADDMPEGKAMPEFIKWMMVDGTYSFDYIMVSDGPDGRTETSGRMAASDDKVSGVKVMIYGEMTVNGELYKSHIIHKDDKAYMLDDVNKSIIELPSNMTETMVVETGDSEKTGEGMGKINEKTLPYDEYTYRDSGSMTRFYFEGDDVYGFEINAGGYKAVYIVSNASGSVPPSVFDFPADYTQKSAPDGFDYDINIG